MDPIVTITLSLTQERVGRADAHELHKHSADFWTAIAKDHQKSTEQVVDKMLKLTKDYNDRFRGGRRVLVG
jgi:hypothetical protein